MKVILVIVLLFISIAAGAGQGGNLKDVYKGKVSVKGSKGLMVELSLNHEPYTDAGSYTLVEKYVGYPKATMLQGEWTVLRGDATDHAAVVIELYDAVTQAPMRYYLRHKDGSIEMLDDKLRKQKGNWVLKKTE